jgi:hypothetical protein
MESHVALATEGNSVGEADFSSALHPSAYPAYQGVSRHNIKPRIPDMAKKQTGLSENSASSAEQKDIYQLKVTLLGIEPLIWRRLLVPADLTLAQLHKVLQVVMGWEDEHLHEFHANRHRIGSERSTPLSAVLQRKGAKMIYTYDLGDFWEHRIVLEKQLLSDPEAIYPVCTGGERACPPEDCGGVPGYDNLVDAIPDPNHPDHVELSAWSSGFNPEAFSVDEVNRVFSSRRRRSKTAAR